MQRFPDGARVCFVGDSITHNGNYVTRIADYYRRHFREARVEFYNCGISGGTLENALNVFEEDTASYDPTHVVLMIGVNDSEMGRLGNPPSAARYDQLAQAYARYCGNMERLYKLVGERGMNLVLCTPVPYAEYQENNPAPQRGGYALMQGYAEYVRRFAEAHDIPLCDYHTEMTKVMQEQTLYNPDSVHPTPTGHFYMAKIFLASQGLTLDADVPPCDEVAEWSESSHALRDLIAAEYFAVPNYTACTPKQRLDAVNAKLQEIRETNLEMNPYIKGLIERYVENISKKPELIANIKRFMQAQ